MKLILLRHGESQWNLENKFTGWKDVSLTSAGKKEAIFSGKQIKEAEIKINSIYTSILNRATETTEIVAEIINFPPKKIQYDWRLNERHYGALQGLNKSETAEKYGEEQVKIWRRSYDIQPPLLDKEDKRHPRFVKKFQSIKGQLPSGESLKEVIDRLSPFWKDYLKNIKKNKGNHLIVAHSNSLRAVMKMLENISNKEIIKLNLPTGVPLLYKFDKNFNIKFKKYLIDECVLNSKIDSIINQGKVKRRK